MAAEVAIMTLPRAKSAFRFFARLSLTVPMGLKARDLGELLEGIRSVPESVIYAHTHRFLQEHQFLVPEPSNDFAVWAVESLQDEAAGERLLAVDTVRYSTIAALRQALAAALEKHLKKHKPDLRVAPVGEEFHFLRSVRFSLPTLHEAWDLAEFGQALKKTGFSSLYLHVFEARLRPPLGLNDFSVWLEGELGEKELSRKVARLDPYRHTLEGLREAILAMISERVEVLSRG